MVRISRSSNRTSLIQQHQRKHQDLLHRHYFNLFIIMIIALCGALYFFLLSIEQRETAAMTVQQADLSDPGRLHHDNRQVPVADDDRAEDDELIDDTMIDSILLASTVLEHDLPFVIYGTAWKKDETAFFVQQAIEAGFRFIDTACQPKHYNELGVGEGIAVAMTNLNLERSDLYIQTKYTPFPGQDPNRVPYNPDDPLSDQVQQSLKVSLHNLQVDYLDGWVLHSPLNSIEETMEVWRTMETAVEEGTVGRLGISNCYDYELFTELYQRAKVKPSILQNRFYGHSNFDVDLRQFCSEHNIWYQSFWTLTADPNRRVLDSPEVTDMAVQKGETPQTLMYAYMMSLGYGRPLDGTKSPIHLEQDLNVMKKLQKEFLRDDIDQVFTRGEMQRFERLLGIGEPTTRTE